ncbi:hypothetical protein E2C01_027398 [Portunus trituberculatus]|uniref:Uncharacterized protein n=1 Tax=Portunus trituberculatus TaxID=210409 RepID=A0A5B7EKQ9_PORTR|nr:hypothetical protein [Portunus trituberculatus]
MKTLVVNILAKQIISFRNPGNPLVHPLWLAPPPPPLPPPPPPSPQARSPPFPSSTPAGSSPFLLKRVGTFSSSVHDVYSEEQDNFLLYNEEEPSRMVAVVVVSVVVVWEY